MIYCLIIGFLFFIGAILTYRKYNVYRIIKRDIIYVPEQLTSIFGIKKFCDIAYLKEGKHFAKLNYMDKELIENELIKYKEANCFEDLKNVDELYRVIVKDSYMLKDLLDNYDLPRKDIFI